VHEDTIVFLCGFALASALTLYCIHLLLEWYCNVRYPGHLELEAANRAVAKNDMMLALAEVNAAIAKNPELWQAYILRAALYHDAGKMEETELDINTFLKAGNPPNGFTYSFQSCQLARLHRYEEALANAEEALKLDPEDEFALTCRIVALDFLNRHDEALATTKRLKGGVQTVVQLTQRASEFMKNEHYEEALDCYYKASQLQPENHGLALGRAACHSNLENFDKMRDELESVLAHNIEDRDARTLWLIYLNETGEHQEALSQAQTMLQKYPDDANLWNTLGNIHVSMKQYSPAMDAFRTASKRDPTDLTNLRNMGFCYGRMGDFQKALDFTQRGLKNEPDSITGRVNLAHYELCSGNVAEAERLLQQVLEKRPDFPHALEEMGWVHYVRGQHEAAEAVWKRAGEIKPSVHKDHDETLALINSLIEQGVFARTSI
jgi:tetratricopeptide (TPR) repeat protein